MAKFSAAEWKKINALLDGDEEKYGLAARRAGSLVLASFNIRKLGKRKNKSDGAWDFLERFCSRCDFIAVQEVLDNLEGLNHLKDRLGYGLVASDITGGVPGGRGMVERLAYLYRWKAIERTEVASDITYDRKVVLDTLFEHRDGFHAAFRSHHKALIKHEKKVRDYIAGGRHGSRPKTPQYVMPQFVTFIRTPLCVSFRILPKRRSKPVDFLAVNAHLLFGNENKHEQEREMEFRALIAWLVYRSRQASRMYHKNMMLFGDLNLDFKKGDARRDAIEAWIKSLNKGQR
ncbi:MAG: endonuclease/exonuclease/phosphatase, partial [SAR324 cluster bacterium]|nr:endonuclease/exonuclease/phosphatase [SAR324 cluster bacterium]